MVRPGCGRPPLALEELQPGSWKHTHAITLGGGFQPLHSPAQEDKKVPVEPTFTGMLQFGDDEPTSCPWPGCSCDLYTGRRSFSNGFLRFCYCNLPFRMSISFLNDPVMIIPVINVEIS